MEPVVAIRPWLSIDERRKCLRHPVRAVEVHIQLEVEVVFVQLDERTHDGHTRVVDQAVKAPAGGPDCLHRRFDVRGDSHVQSNGLNILDGVEGSQVFRFSGAPHKRKAPRREQFSRPLPIHRAGTGHQDGPTAPIGPQALLG